MVPGPRLGLALSICRRTFHSDQFDASLLPNSDHVRRCAKQRWFFFNGTQKLQQQRALLWVVPMLRKIPHHPNWPFDRNDSLERESRVLDLLPQFVRTMEKR